MKTKLFHLVCLLTVMAFAGACGKEKKSSSSSNPNSGYNPILDGSVVGNAGYTELLNWLNAADTNSGMRAYYVKKTGSMNSWFESVLCQPTGINLPVCIKPTSCFASVGSAVQLGSTVFDNLRPKNCNLGNSFYNKTSDATLREAVLGKSGRVVLKDQTRKSGSIYTVYYSLYEGSAQVSGEAWFNTSLPAVLNPIIIEEGSTRTKTFFLPY